MNKKAAREELDKWYLKPIQTNETEKAWLMSWAQRHFGQPKVTRYRMDNSINRADALTAFAESGHKVWIEQVEAEGFLGDQYYLCVEVKEAGDD